MPSGNVCTERHGTQSAGSIFVDHGSGGDRFEQLVVSLDPPDAFDSQVFSAVGVDGDHTVVAKHHAVEPTREDQRCSQRSFVPRAVDDDDIVGVAILRTTDRTAALDVHDVVALLDRRAQLAVQHVLRAGDGDLDRACDECHVDGVGGASPDNDHFQIVRVDEDGAAVSARDLDECHFHKVNL